MTDEQKAQQKIVADAMATAAKRFCGDEAERDGRYLVTLDWWEVKKIFVHRVFYTKERGWDLSVVVQNPVKILAWKPLPEPYKP